MATINLQGRRILVTGAARGMGEAIARLFVLEGASVFELLAKMSPVDFRDRAFPAGAIAQTTCAKVVVQLYCLARAPRPRVLIAVDSTLATHLSECMADAMTEYR